MELVAQTHGGHLLVEDGIDVHAAVADGDVVDGHVLVAAVDHELGLVLLADGQTVDGDGVRIALQDGGHREHVLVHGVDVVLRKHRHEDVGKDVVGVVAGQTHAQLVLAQLVEVELQGHGRRGLEGRFSAHAVRSGTRSEAEGVLLHQHGTGELQVVVLVVDHVARLHVGHLSHTHGVHGEGHDVLASEAVAQEELAHLVEADGHLAVLHVEGTLAVVAVLLAEEQVILVRDTETVQHVLLVHGHQSRGTETRGSGEALHVLHGHHEHRLLGGGDLRYHVELAVDEAVAQTHGALGGGGQLDVGGKLAHRGSLLLLLGHQSLPEGRLVAVLVDHLEGVLRRHAQTAEHNLLALRVTDHHAVHQNL